MQSLVTLTLNPTVDKSSQLETVASEIKLRCDVPTFDPGGGGINVARAVTYLGGQAHALYTAGGSSGTMLKHLLERETITQTPLPIADFTRENLTIYERSSGLQYRFGMPGPALTEAEWRDSIQQTIALGAGIVVASGSLPRGVPDDYYARLTRALTEAGARTIVDTSGEALLACAYQGVYVMKPNIHELEQMSGQKFAGEDHLRDVAQALIRDGFAEILVISMGSGGALMVTADEVARLRPPVVPIKSKVGAGDSMVGGLSYALARGDDLLEAVRWGVAAGSAAVMTEGTQLCRREDAERLYEQIHIST